MPKKTNYEKNGTKYFRLTADIGRDETGKRIRKEFYGKSKSEAEKKRDEYLTGIESGMNLNYKDMTLSELMRIWLFDVMKVECSDSTFDRYEGIYRNYICTTKLQYFKVSEISRLILQRHYNEMYDLNGSTTKILNLNKLLKTFFNYAIAEGYLLKNPCFKISIPRDKNIIETEGENDVDPFNDDEIRLINEHINPTVRMIFQLDLGTGLRIGELLALSKNDIDFEKAEVKVNKTLKFVKQINYDGTYEYNYVIKPPKSKSSIRTVPIPINLITLLKKHIEDQQEKFKLNNMTFNNKSLMFTTDSCKHIDSKNLLRSWERTLRRANVRYRKQHNIRHTYATRLFEAGVPLITISKLLGHHSIEITAKVYVHVMPKEKNDAAQVLNYLFNEF